MPAYNKLVRDKIPHIIKSKGKSCRTTILNEVQYKEELNKKLSEEISEYNNAANATEALEELADVLEVIQALAKVHGMTWEQLESLRMDKAEQRGGFQERVYLIEVDGGS
ncbi:nucleoside triphosphate pyrophosphohydrolase [Paenibacillus sp. GSMTC-2017]|uniref:nucleoside triphosphate pyrophosphohydrolase n=1 Tax=Paenibacillus sp. GSMTC-2017 TaxID=2794350 RepID=UPI0018D96B30|nr:nucleoside triphosphate pyrophosphohydrolase [Paenibacillus sp. GSMTC-2017]MBH5318563.1 nucleoside triphosphate pyrophosphohydrolase [Paenibacillus sp. GSMTC-2017]